MKSEKNIWNMFGFAMVLSLLMVLSFSCSNSESDRPEVALYAYKSADISLHMIFDVKNRGVLCDKPGKAEILNKLSEDINPRTSFDYEGNFWILVSTESNDASNTMKYGSYSIKGIGSGNEKTWLYAFKRLGAGEKTIGRYGSNIWLFDNGNSRKIGEMAYAQFITPEGKQSLDVFTRISDQDSPWLIDIGDKIYKRTDDGNLRQVGWVGWRKITTNDGKQYVILMTKGMDKNGKWAGRFDGKLYVDK